MATIPYSHVHSKPFRTPPHTTRGRVTDATKPGALNEQISQVYARLQCMSTLFKEKHLPASASSLSDTLAATATPRRANAVGSAESQPTPSSPTIPESTTLLRIAPDLTEGRDGGGTSCVCQEVCTPASPGHCGQCSLPLATVQALRQQLADLQTELDQSRHAMRSLQRQNDLQRHDIDEFSERIIRLEDELDQGRQEAASLRTDVRVLNEKVVDEIEKVAETQHAKQLVEEELEELSQKLFEQANGMVASEARQRHETQSQLSETRQELEELQSHFAAVELRHKQMQAENERLTAQLAAQMFDRATGAPQAEAAVGGDSEKRPIPASISTASMVSGLTDPDPVERPSSPLLDQVTDEQLFLEFQDFVYHCSSSKLFKVHSFNFMKNCLAEDVEPGLRFGPTPRMSSKNLLDAILYDTLIIEPVTQDERLVAPPPVETTTASVATRFLSSKQALLWERFSGTVTANPHGCQACGRTGDCTYRFQMGYYEENEEWCYVDQFCRDRLTSVCEFYQFIRNIYQGLYSNRSMQELYMESQRLRLRILYARMGSFSLFQLNPGYLIRKLNTPNMAPRKPSMHRLSGASTAGASSQPTAPSTPVPATAEVDVDADTVAAATGAEALPDNCPPERALSPGASSLRGGELPGSPEKKPV